MAPSKKRRRSPPEEAEESDDVEVTFKVFPPPPSSKRARLHEVDEVADAVLLPRRSPNGFLLPDPLPPGWILRDNAGQAWRLGKAIGLGGFGEIYSAAREGQEQEEFVVKVKAAVDIKELIVVVY